MITVRTGRRGGRLNLHQFLYVCMGVFEKENGEGESALLSASGGTELSREGDRNSRDNLNKHFYA